MQLNGDDIGLLSDADRASYYQKLAEVAQEQNGGGFVVEGEDPFAREWQMDFDWPERAGVPGPSGPEGDPEWIPDSLDAPVVQGTFVFGQRHKKTGRVREATLRRVEFGDNDLRQMRETAGWDARRLREDFGGSPDPFAYGSSQAVPGVGGANSQYVPLWPGPVTRQLYWGDYWMMSAKAFEAYNHDPISWRCVHMKAEFSLGRGLQCKVTQSRGSGQGQTHSAASERWEEFWKRNKMDQRLDTVARDYCWAGEQFIRYFHKRVPGKPGQQLTVRALDPATIYDLITDPEDIETVFAYHQQFQTAYQLYPPQKGTPPTGISAPTGSSQPGAMTRYIIRQILPQDIDHYKANSSSSERRGRSDLFPALGWIKRLRDYLTAHVIQADMLSRICWDLEVAGNAASIQNLRNLLFPNGRPPQPGTVFGHNSASKLNVITPPTTSAAASRGDPVLDALVTMIADAIGLPKDWLGFGLQNTRAGALVATEPAAKSLEELQGTLEGMVHDAFDRCMAAALITDAQLEVTFPSIASEDRKQKLDDLGTMEANGWLAKRTTAAIAAKEMGITNFDYEVEQKLIAEEFPAPETEQSDSGLLGPDGKPVNHPKQGDGKPRRTVLIATKRQAAKLDITKSSMYEDEPPGLLVPEDGSDPASANLPAPGSGDGTGRTVPGGGSHNNGVTRGGAPANENPNSAAGAANIRKDSTNMRETVIPMTVAQLQEALHRERQAARRRPDDPDYEAIQREYRQSSRENLEQLVSSVRTGEH